MLPNVTNGQHKLNHQMFAQQNVEDSLSDQRLSSQQQKVRGMFGFLTLKLLDLASVFCTKFLIVRKHLTITFVSFLGLSRSSTTG